MNKDFLGDDLTSPHQPVLYNEILTALVPESGRKYLDCTLGAGGHAFGILERSSPFGQLLVLDLDPEAIKIAQSRLCTFSDRVHIRNVSYLDAKDVLRDIGWDKVDGVVMDLGVSSMQIDNAERGFSFQKDGALDMRFHPGMGISAADLVNNTDEQELANILWHYGEEKLSRRIASAIVKNRPVTRTVQLADIIRQVVRKHYTRIDPATRSFQALRIAVNKELVVLENALPELASLLNPGGRMAIISFHSLEDRIVKLFFKKESTNCICPPEQPVCNCAHQASIRVITHHPIQAGDLEIEANGRSRSAKLRIAERIL